MQRLKEKKLGMPPPPTKKRGRGRVTPPPNHTKRGEVVRVNDALNSSTGVVVTERDKLSQLFHYFSSSFAHCSNILKHGTQQ